MAGSFKTYRPASKASKPKHRKWDSQQRFSKGHDAACLSLLPEEDIFEKKNGDRKPHRRAQKVGVYRAATFGMSREERILEDALFFLNAGMADTMELALEKARQNYGE